MCNIVKLVHFWRLPFSDLEILERGTYYQGWWVGSMFFVSVLYYTISAVDKHSLSTISGSDVTELLWKREVAGISIRNWFTHPRHWRTSALSQLLGLGASQRAQAKITSTFLFGSRPLSKSYKWTITHICIELSVWFRSNSWEDLNARIMLTLHVSLLWFNAAYISHSLLTF